MERAAVMVGFVVMMMIMDAGVQCGSVVQCSVCCANLRAPMISWFTEVYSDSKKWGRG